MTPGSKLSRHAKGSANHPTQSKILMSINSVVMSVAASYRTLKRGAVTFRHTIFIYLSLLCQVVLQKQQKRQRQLKRQRQRLSAISKTPILLSSGSCQNTQLPDALPLPKEILPNGKSRLQFDMSSIPLLIYRYQ